MTFKVFGIENTQKVTCNISKLGVNLESPAIMDKWLQWNREVVLWFSASARTLTGEAKLDFARRAGTPTY